MASATRYDPGYVGGYPPMRAAGSQPAGGGSATYPAQGSTPPGSPMLWYDAQDINLLGNAGIADNDPIGTWKNKGSLGSAADLIQAVGGARPLFKLVADGVKLNGLSGVLADGIDDTMATAAFAAQAQPNLYVAVFRTNQIAVPWVLFNGNGGGAQRNQASSAATTVNLYAGSFYLSTAPVALNTWHTLGAFFNDVNSVATIDGVAAASGSPGTQPLGAFEIFASAGLNFMSGYLVELVGYNAPPGSVIEATVRAYLAVKYGITPQ